jgi:hypothetical protein
MCAVRCRRSPPRLSPPRPGPTPLPPTARPPPPSRLPPQAVAALLRNRQVAATVWAWRRKGPSAGEHDPGAGSERGEGCRVGGVRDEDRHTLGGIFKKSHSPLLPAPSSGDSDGEDVQTWEDEQPRCTGYGVDEVPAVGSASYRPPPDLCRAASSLVGPHLPRNHPCPRSTAASRGPASWRASQGRGAHVELCGRSARRGRMVNSAADRPAGEKNSMRAARTGRWVRTPSWRLAIGSDARGSRAARAPLPCVLLGSAPDWPWIGSRRNQGKTGLRPVAVLRRPHTSPLPALRLTTG